MKLITANDRKRLLANAARKTEQPDFDPLPVVKLQTLFLPCTWLLTELDPGDPNMAYGLCDLGMGSPEIGSVYLPELAALKMGPMAVVERDQFFKASKTLSAYADEARAAGRIIA